METTYTSIGRWIGEDVVSISKEYYSTMKNKDIMPLVTTWMKSEGILLSEISQMEKNTVDLICSEILKKKKKRSNL